MHGHGVRLQSGSTVFKSICAQAPREGGVGAAWLPVCASSGKPA
jgi:hypothetical protein